MQRELWSGTNFCDDHLAALHDDNELDLVANLYFVEKGLVFDVEDHRHGRHVQIPDRAMLDRELANALVYLANFAVSHRCIGDHIHAGLHRVVHLRVSEDRHQRDQSNGQNSGNRFEVVHHYSYGRVDLTPAPGHPIVTRLKQ